MKQKAQRLKPYFEPHVKEPERQGTVLADLDLTLRLYSFAKVGFRFFSPAIIASSTSFVCNMPAFQTLM